MTEEKTFYMVFVPSYVARNRTPEDTPGPKHQYETEDEAMTAARSIARQYDKDVFVLKAVRRISQSKPLEVVDLV